MFSPRRKNFNNAFAVYIFIFFVIMTAMCGYFVLPYINGDRSTVRNLKNEPFLLNSSPTIKRIINSDATLKQVLNSVKSLPNQQSDTAKEVLSETELKHLKEHRERNVKYGGGDVDLEHLGGFVENDTDTYERELWEWFIELFNISSVLDVGCGMGYSTVFFEKYLHNKWHGKEKVLCVEGSQDAINHSLAPAISIHHDYTKGAWWPEDSYDMAWCAEFLEHVDEEYMSNYMSTFKKAKFILVTHSIWGGWHHTCVHESPWWIEKFESYGFQYQPKLTEMAREHCPMVKDRLKYSYHRVTNEGHRLMSHFLFHGLIFINKLFLYRLTPFDQMLLSKFGQSFVW